jgi:5-methylcytosine-specific restriction endonuclease McrA
LCNEVKPAAAFRRDGSRRDGLNPRCRDCCTQHYPWHSHRETRYQNNRDRRARAAALPTETYTREQIIAHRGTICHLCGEHTDDPHIDHLIPLLATREQLAAFGIDRHPGNVIANLDIACPTCNYAKGARFTNLSMMSIYGVDTPRLRLCRCGLAVAVVAHPPDSRPPQQRAGSLGARLVVDEHEQGEWPAHARALAWAAEEDATHALIVQDDAVPVPGLLDHVAAAMGRVAAGRSSVADLWSPGERLEWHWPGGARGRFRRAPGAVPVTSERW